MNPVVDPQAMRNTLRLWASGVSIVSTADGDAYGGLTISSFTSLSLEPPMILVCVHKDSHTIPLIERSGVLAVSILSSEQSHLSDRFAGRVPLADDHERFNGVDTFTAVTGCPLIAGAIAWLDCSVASRHDGSTHWIYIGQVVATGTNKASEEPLLYFNRSYRAVEKVSAGS
jgi:flavin reductase (DIM6/NTAB) family NADH-FMN oxidoreductase RutF